MAKTSGANRGKKGGGAVPKAQTATSLTNSTMGMLDKGDIFYDGILGYRMAQMGENSYKISSSEVEGASLKVTRAKMQELLQSSYEWKLNLKTNRASIEQLVNKSLKEYKGWGAKEKGRQLKLLKEQYRTSFSLIKTGFVELHNQNLVATHTLLAKIRNDKL